MKDDAFALVAMAALAAFFIARTANAGAVSDSKNAGLISEGDPAFSVATPASAVNTWADTGPLYSGLGGIMNLSPNGLDALKSREGFAPTQYPDHKGYSIGYGHLILPTDPYNADTVLSEAEAAQILAGDVSWAESAVANRITALLNQNQFDALVSFCFNVGATQFGTSTLVKRINASDPDAVSEFARWNMSSGVVDASLIRRRQSEVTQYLS